MYLFKRANKITDERIENVRNKIYKELYHLIMASCVISMLIKTYKYGIGNQDFLLEYVLIFGGTLYYLVRSIFLGVFSDEIEMHDRVSKTSMSKKSVYIGIGFTIIIAIIMGINSALSYADSSSQGIWYFVLVSIVTIIIYSPIFLLIGGVIYFLVKKFGPHDQEDDTKL